MSGSPRDYVQLQKVSVNGGLRATFDRLVLIQNSAYERAGSKARIVLGPGANDADIDKVEARIGRFLPEEVRELYRWHDGAMVWLFPNTGFGRILETLETYLAVREFEIPKPSNFPGAIEPGSLFPVFDADKNLMPIATAEGSRQERSPLFVLNFEMDQLTMIAHSLTQFLDRALSESSVGISR